jgi:CRP/FNR family transcriptional regulator, cyclic AMP receptor protein
MKSALTRLVDHPMLAGLPVQAVERMSRFSTHVVFQAGDVVFNEGNPASALYLMQSGRVVISTHAPGKGHLLIQTVGPGEALGLSWLFPPFKWQFDARCLNDADALEVDGPSLRAELEADPAFGYEFLKRYAPVVLGRLQQTRLRLLDLYSKGP